MNRQNFRSWLRLWWVWVVLVLVVGGASYGAYRYFFAAPGDATADSSGKGPGGGRRGGGSVPVVVVAAKTGDIGVYLNGLGTVIPLNTVTVKTRIDGQLMRVLFREGQLVKSGDLLAEIDPRTYQVQLAQAEGQMARDLALAKNAQLDVERYRTLFKEDSISKQQLDTQESVVRQYEGTVKVDQAAIDSAKLQLTYCRITAPVSGRLGLRQVDPGNMVRAGDANGLVVITQLQPITVVFTIAEDNVPSVMKRLQTGEKPAVEAWDRADKMKLAAGVLASVDNQIDPATGTVKLKAQFSNDDLALFPNQFVNTRMLLETRRDAILIPTAAIQRGTPGTFVYVVKADNTVTVRTLKLGTTLADRAAVESGLAVGEIVVVDGADKLREGAKVEIADRSAGSSGRQGGKGDGKEGGKGGWGGKKIPDGAPAGPGAPAAAPVTAPATGAPAAAGAAPAAAPGSARPASPPAPASTPAAPQAGFDSLTPEEKRARWADVNARIDRGEFGEEIKKLSEDDRKKKMRELRQQRDAGGK